MRELHSLLQTKTVELEGSHDIVRKLRREYTSTRQDAEGMLQVMTGLEKQVGEFSARGMSCRLLIDVYS